MKRDNDRLAREEAIRDYLLKKLDPDQTEAFEQEYLSSEDAFEDLQASRMLMFGLGETKLETRHLDDVTVLGFSCSASLVRQSPLLQELLNGVRQRSNGKVLIDLGRVTRVDSSGLGLLITCYSHTVRNRGMLKFLNPGTAVKDLFRLTRVDSIIESYHDEQEAIRSFLP